MMAGSFLKISNRRRRMLVSIMGFVVVMVVLDQYWVLPFGRYIYTLSPDEAPIVMLGSPFSWKLATNGSNNMVEGVSKMGEGHGESRLTLHYERSELNDVALSMNKSRSVETGVKELNVQESVEDAGNMGVSTNYSVNIVEISVDKMKPLGTRPIVSPLTSSSQMHKMKQFLELEVVNKNDSSVIERYVRRMRGATITLSDMKSMLLNGPAFKASVKRRSSSTSDRQLLSASLQIKNAPVLKNFSDLHAPLYRNVSVFRRSYDLMERVLKVYVYKEGDKPIFHHPRLRGLYAAEGWFMKLIERSTHFIVRDPKKAHLYYLPFSAETLRTTIYGDKKRNIKDLEQYLTNYVDLIKTRYRFWNRTGGADHFFVACHDWGPRITRQYMSSCIRGLCNANVARGFSVGKDVSVPVTYLRSGNDPTRDIGGKPPSERNILAFFAGQLHGYLRPLLLQYWENKVPDMKIFGPMPRDNQGKAVYRDYMKSSKYCICARGYGVHSPRIVESIFYECIPVIISDNYVPPFFEVLDWEAFAVFIREKDIPNLRNILLSIPEEHYLVMQQRIKIVQRHFKWHKTPEKYDLFHMILHSVWYSRVSQIRAA